MTMWQILKWRYHIFCVNLFHILINQLPLPSPATSPRSSSLLLIHHYSIPPIHYQVTQCTLYILYVLYALYITYYCKYCTCTCWGPVTPWGFCWPCPISLVRYFLFFSDRPLDRTCHSVVFVCLCVCVFVCVCVCVGVC